MENSLLRTISDQIVARQQLDGIYLVIEQSADRGHCYNCEEGCLAILLLIDDLNRGAGKQIIINYAGLFLGLFAWPPAKASGRAATIDPNDA